jgi:hypothetical protein
LIKIKGENKIKEINYVPHPDLIKVYLEVILRAVHMGFMVDKVTL